jgi:diphthine-ammonia ligase
MILPIYSIPSPSTGEGEDEGVTSQDDPLSFNPLSQRKRKRKNKKGMNMEKAFVSWSGGKDCCQAAYQAIRQGIEIDYLLNTVTADKNRSCSHGISARWIKLQSEAMGIPLIHQATAGDNYEAMFIDAILKLKSEGTATGVFGDIDFEPHREWIQRVCEKAAVRPVLPLWQKDQMQIATDFIDLGFVSVVIATQSDLLGEEWLGRKFDARFLNELSAYNAGISPCGEAGEFHTLVIDGPLFKKRIEILETEKVKRDNHWFLDIQKCELVSSSFRGTQ